MLKILTVLSLFIYSSAYANIVGTNIQNFNPTTSGVDFVTVQSANTLEAGYVNFGFFINRAGNSLPSFENDDGERLDANDTLMYADFNLGVGLSKNLDFGLSFPVVLSQEIDESTQNILFAENGLTEIRANLKYTFTKIKDWKGAFIFSINHNLIENNPYAGNDAGNTFNGEFAFGRKFNIYNFAFNLGYRSRNSGSEIRDSIIQPLENQWIGSVGLSRKWREDSKVSIIGELLASIPTEVNGRTSISELSSYEGLLGLKYNHSKRVASHAGVGVGLVADTASPDWRIYAGLNWTFGPLWKNQGKKKRKRTRHTHKHSHRQEDGSHITHKHKHSHVGRVSHNKKSLGDHSHSSPNSFEDHSGVRHSHEHTHQKDDGSSVTHSHIHSHSQKISHSEESLSNHSHSSPNSFENHSGVRHSHEHTHQRDDGSSVTHSHIHSHSQKTSHGEESLSNHSHSKPESFEEHFVAEDVDTIERVKRYRLDNLNFRSGSAKFNKNIGTKLKKFLILLKRKNQTIKKLVIEGHTDATGNFYSNQDLSLRRAQELKRLVIRLSRIDGDIIEVVGKGESDPISTNETVEGRRENRRVEVYVSE